nr:hypothetical protein [Tanacetum cinerariifolium]
MKTRLLTCQQSVRDPAALRSVVEGCNKIIYCATAQSLDEATAKYDGGMDAKFEFSESGDAVFLGYVFTRGYVDFSTKLSLPLGSTLDMYEDLIFFIGGNGRSYVLILESGPTADASHSIQYFSRISTKVGFCRVKVPLRSFQPVNPADPPLDPFLIHTFTIRFEPRRQKVFWLGVVEELLWFFSGSTGAKVSDIYHPLAFRRFLLGTHYRSPNNYSIDLIKISSDAVYYIYESLYNVNTNFGRDNKKIARGTCINEIMIRKRYLSAVTTRMERQV